MAGAGRTATPPNPPSWVKIVSRGPTPPLGPASFSTSPSLPTRLLQLYKECVVRGTWARLVFETRGGKEEFSFFSGSAIAAKEAAGVHRRQGKKSPANKRRKERARRRREAWLERRRPGSSQPGSKTATGAATAPAAGGAAITPPAATGTGLVPPSLPAVARAAVADAVRGEATATAISPAAAAGTTAAVEKAGATPVTAAAQATAPPAKQMQ
jgi:hypothetical protein